MENNFSYSLVLPVYREIRNLEILIPKILKTFDKIKRPVEIIVVDDDSQDGTAEFIRQLQKRGNPIKFIERKKEKGFSTALLAGTNASSLSSIVHMDADLAHDTGDLLRIVRIYESTKNPAVVVGSRYVKGSLYKGKPFLNQISGRIASIFCRLLLGLPIVDVSNNFRIFPASLWRKIYPDISISGNVMLVQELILMKNCGAHFTEIPTTYIERRFGDSKLHVFKEAKSFFQALPTLIRNKYNKA